MSSQEGRDTNLGDRADSQKDFGAKDSYMAQMSAGECGSGLDWDGLIDDQLVSRVMSELLARPGDSNENEKRRALRATCPRGVGA